MKIFLIFRDHTDKVCVPIIRALEKEGHQVLYWLGVQNNSKEEFPHTIFHSDADARQILPAKGIDPDKFMPPGADIAERLSETESLMMSLLEKRNSNLYHSQQKHNYHKLLRYWLGVFKKFKPDVIIFPTSPANFVTFFIHQLAKLFKVKTIMFSDSWIGDRTIVHTDFWEPGQRILDEKIEANKDKNFSLNELSQDIQKYYKPHAADSHDAAPMCTKQINKRYSGLNLFKYKLNIIKKNIGGFRIVRIFASHLKKRFGANLRKEHFELEKKPNLNEKFVYLPLQYQPERSTSPLGGIFVDQILLVETVSAALPRGWKIYIKEHPYQWQKNGLNYNFARPRGYYEKIAAIKNVTLVPITTDSFDLINRSKAVVTTTGTPAWEAYLRKKPSIIFGTQWFRSCPQIFKANDAVSCRNAFEKIRQGHEIKDQDIINYLKSIEEASIHCLIDELVGDKLDLGESDLTFDQRLSNVIEAIIDELNHFKKNSHALETNQN
jgi:hypothetical protein